MNKQATTLEEPFETGVVEIQTTGSEISVVDVVAFLLRRRKLIGSVTAFVTVVGAITMFLLPPSYKAEATILPPQQGQSSMAALAAGAMGGAAASGMASQLGLKNPADLYIGILKSRSIADAIVQRFHLQDVYRKKRWSDTRKALGKYSSFASGKDTLITISVTDRDPRRAADIANAYVDELHNVNSRLALTDASQRRLFFERELIVEKDALANAEVALKATEQATGLLVPSGQAEALIKSAAEIRAQITGRQVELKAIQAYATDENPKVQVLRREIGALQGQLSQMEASGSGSRFEVAGSKLPEASLEYVRKMRDVKYHEALFELMAKQYEAARIDEAKQAPVIQVVDRAVVPDKESRMSRSVVLIAVLLFGSALGCGLAYGLECFSKLRTALHGANSFETFQATA